MVQIKTFEANELSGLWSIEDYCNGWLRAKPNMKIIHTNLISVFDERLKMMNYILTVVYKEIEEDGNKK